MDRPDEIKALSDLAGDALEETVRVVEDVHTAVADRVDAHLPPAAKPVSAIVRAQTALTYQTVRAAHKWIPRGLGRVAAARTDPDGPSLLASPGRARTAAALHGIWGASASDRLGATPQLTLFHHGDPVDPSLLTALVADAPPNLVLLLHGLSETEADWERQPRDLPEPRTPYAPRLEAEEPVTVLAVRYPTGLAIGENGQALAAMLDEVDARWPDLATITLVGHSMGGLVARSAAHHADADGRDWVTRLKLIVTLGSPHLGAPLAQAVDLAEKALGAFPESAPIGRVLGTRSPGVRDLSDGRILVGDTEELDPPVVPGVTYCTVASTLTENPGHPVAQLLGDGMVLVPSARGRNRTRHLDFHADRHIGGLNHIAMLNDPQVYELIRGWIDEFTLTGG